jgi:hypothetical protein
MNALRLGLGIFCRVVSHTHQIQRILQRKVISRAESEIQPVTSKNGTRMYLRTRGGPDNVCRKGWQHCTLASDDVVNDI